MEVVNSQGNIVCFTDGFVFNAFKGTVVTYSLKQEIDKAMINDISTPTKEMTAAAVHGKLVRHFEN